MSTYRSLDLLLQNRAQFPFKGKKEHIAKENRPNLAYLKHCIDPEIPYGSRDHVVLPEAIKIKVNLEIYSTEKTRCVVNNVGKLLVKEIFLML